MADANPGASVAAIAPQLAVIRGTTLGNALTHHYGQQLGALASILRFMHATTQKAMDRFNSDMARLTAAGVP